MGKKICFYVFMLFEILAWGQGYREDMDTITFTYRIGGKIDSIDLISGPVHTTFPGGGRNTRSTVLEPSFIFSNPGGQLFWSNKPFKPYLFSGLPHLGVAYMFGSNAQQYIRAEFQQVFKGNLMLNIDYEKNASNGILRNSRFNHENIQLKLCRKANVFSFDLKSAYESSFVEQSGGLVNDSLAEKFDLILLPVNRSASNLHTQRSVIKLDQFFDFQRDSTKSLGLFMPSEFRIKKYQLRETGALGNFYPVINFDSSSTSDLHQWSSLSSGIGVFSSGKKWLTRWAAQVNYWNFQHLERWNDTMEVKGIGQFIYHDRALKCLFNGMYTFFGAQQEWKGDMQCTYRIFGVDWSLSSMISAQLPDYYQRYALGNNTLPVDKPWSLQFRQMHELQFRKDWKNFSVRMFTSLTQAKNNYWFIKYTWRNDTLSNFAFGQLGFNIAYRWKLLNAQLDYRNTSVGGVQSIIPMHQLFSRLYLKGGIFKARKLLTYAGIELGWLSAFHGIGYLTQAGALSLVNSGVHVPQQMVIHFFSGFQIDEFKFFVRAENLQSFSVDKSIQLIKGYPVAPLQIKVGITWDFFD